MIYADIRKYYISVLL